MPIVFSDHAKKQLRRRKIQQEMVIQTIRHPQEILPSFKGRRLRRRAFGDKILQAVTITEGSKITVVSSYYLRRKRYENKL